jgi:hypothetical protein
MLPALTAVAPLGGRAAEPPVDATDMLRDVVPVEKLKQGAGRKGEAPLSAGLATPPSLMRATRADPLRAPMGSAGLLEAVGGEHATIGIAGGCARAARPEG